MNKRTLVKAEILILTSILAFCSIVYELLLANTLGIITGNYVWWQSLTIGVYIGGLGLGAYFSNRLKDTYLNLINVEVALSFLGALSVFYVYVFHGIYKYLDSIYYFTSDYNASIYLQNIFVAKIMFFIIVQILTLAIGVLSGFEIPLMMKMAELRLGTSEDNEYRIFGINYIGTLIGSVLFAYLLLPEFDVIKTSAIVAFINLLVCLYFLIKYLPSKIKKYAPVLVGVLAIIVLIGVSEKEITQRYLKIFYYMPRILSQNNGDLDDAFRRIDQLPKVERMKSLYQYVDIFDYPIHKNGTKENATILTLDTNFQFNTATEFYYHQAFAHVSIAMNKVVPKKILLLGGGDGLLLRELIKYKEIESIHFIELDGKMFDLARTRFAKLNEHSLSDPRVKAEINDGFYYLRNSHEKYDAIFIDFPYPNSYDLSRLYSIEFYTYVKKALNPDGFVVLDAPFSDKPTTNKDRIEGRAIVAETFNDVQIRNNSIIASTFYYAGFKTIFPYRVSEESFLFLKTDSGDIDFNFMDSTDLSKLNPETIREMHLIKDQNFPYKIANKYINSIFKPLLSMKNEL
jgi:spermidine synthase